MHKLFYRSSYYKIGTFNHCFKRRFYGFFWKTDLARVIWGSLGVEFVKLKGNFATYALLDGDFIGVQSRNRYIYIYTFLFHLHFPHTCKCLKF
jgi:hypothetical protein